MSDEGFRDFACDVMDPACPARSVLEMLASKWTLLVIHALSEGPRRTGALRRRVGGISEKVLTQTLRTLMDAGLVDRREEAGPVRTVEYRLTDRGRSLSPIVRELDRWAETNAPSIIAPA